MEAKTEDFNKLEKAVVKQKSLDKRKLYDKIATYVVSAGGIGVILSIIAILFFIGIEAVPLWESPSAELTSEFDVSPVILSQSSPITQNPVVAEKSGVAIVGTEEHREISFVLFENGVLKFLSLNDGSVIESSKIENLEGSKITSSFISNNNQSYSVGTNDGYIIPIDTNYKAEFKEDGTRVIIPEFSESAPVKVTDQSITNHAFTESGDGSTSVASFLTDSRELFYYAVTEEEEGGLSLSFGEVSEEDIEKKNEVKINLTQSLNGGEVAEIQIDSSLMNLYVGTQGGKIFNWDISDKNNPELESISDVTKGATNSITAMGFLLGERSLILGDNEGNLSVWFQARNDKGEKILQKVHTLPPMKGAINLISRSPRDRGFIASDTNGNIGLYYATSEEKRYEFEGDGEKYNAITFSPKANGIIAVESNGNLKNWFLDNPHPETNFKTLFGKVWYEGYTEPQYVWQSTGGTDDFEPKLSVTPLIYGTLKGALYALIFAIPLAIFSALCVSQFMHPSLRNIIKPAIEVMAALPSVILGFFAGLWLAPIIEDIFPAVITMPFIITAFTLISVYLWQNVIPDTITGRFRVGGELFLLVPVVILAILVSLWLSGPVESLLFGGAYKNWFYEIMGLRFDQRNSLIVGFAMGFAVIPIIFTISEDALSSVPRNLTAGSLALGANRWQTAIKIVLPSASPGIFSAVMIGLGRAVGETMIVLMATGNTPIMDWSFFNGFRALSANIAVELPEAPHGGTLYRVLFLTAIILFFFTFILNTVAELIRQRLRKKYGDL